MAPKQLLVRCVISAGFSLLLTPLAAQGQDEDRGCVPITDPLELSAMGFEPADLEHGTIVCMDENAVTEAALEPADGTPLASDEFSAISAKEFFGRLDATGTSWRYAGGPNCCVDLSRAGTEQFADAQFDALHEGMQIQSFRLWAFDANVAADLSLFVFENCQPAFAGGPITINTIVNLNPATTGSSGHQFRVASGAPLFPRNVNNRDCTYLARVRFDAAATNLALQKVRFDFGSPAVAHQRTVRRFTSASLTNADADLIMSATDVNGAGRVLQTNDGLGDVACNVAMTRQGNVTVFSDGDGSIDTSAELNAVFALPGNIKVVNDINFCAGPNPNVIGCAPRPGNTLVVVRFTPSSEGILWAHEFGHNKGLPHVVPDDPNRVMNRFITGTARRVNAAECDAFRVPSPATPAREELVVVQASEAGVVSDAGGSDRNVDVADFVRRIYPQGLPYEEAAQYDSSAVPTLLAMLGDPAERAHWSNIVITLGAIGDERAVAPLIELVQAETDDEEILSREEYDAKQSVFMALGMLSNKSGNQRALEFLQDSLDPGIWEGSGVGLAPWHDGTTERNQDFSTQAVWGLALSGRPEAAAALRSLQRTGRTQAQRGFQAQAGDLVEEALNVNERVQTVGLARYYEAMRE